MPGGFNLLESAIAEKRSQSSWNRWLESAERPASDHEEAKIERAADMASVIVQRNQILSSLAVQVRPQGSYYNNTNTRNEADMDLRVQMDDIRITYGPGIDTTSVYSQLYTPATRSLEETAAIVRGVLAADLVEVFGSAAVDTSGNKAITVHGLDGSRADCDLVPAFHLHHIHLVNGSLYRQEGVAILGRDGRWTHNYPTQHHDNGIRKRGDTALRFKRNVRMLKRLNYELEAVGDIQSRLPSFLIECLVYRVPDREFLFEEDDRYIRLLRILASLNVLLNDSTWWLTAREINDIKPLFGSEQSWSLPQAQRFVAAALARMSL